MFPPSSSANESSTHMASGLRALYPGISPAVILDELGAGQSPDGCGLGRKEQARNLEHWLSARGLGIPKSSLEIGFVGAGAEHETYFDTSGHVAVKLTTSN